eukprot:scaffold22575_cov141-Cylindrotheca_fusiformis.AAC.18
MRHGISYLFGFIYPTAGDLDVLLGFNVFVSLTVPGRLGVSSRILFRRNMSGRIRLLLFLLLLDSRGSCFAPSPARTLAKSAAFAAVDAEQLTMDTPLRPSLDGLFEIAEKAAAPKEAETSEGAHDAFRYEWGVWVDDDIIQELMARVNDIRLAPGVYETWENGDDSPSPSRRLRIAGGDHWDCILHVLPKGKEWRGRWPTGSWAVVRTLTGVAEIAMLRGPNRDGFFTKATKKDLRGGGDGTLAGGSAGGGEDSVKYVGGALRSYTGKSGKTTLLEVVVRPPIGKEKSDGDGQESNAMEQLESPDKFLTVAVTDDIEDSEEKEEENHSAVSEDKPKHLGTKIGMDFDQVGGLDDQLNSIVRRVLASRANPEASRRLGVSHVRGILLSGPPGCGKTLLARELSALLGAREPQIVNGPEILDKFVGEAEKNIRALFTPAEIEYNQVGDKSALHVIILDEMDAIARKRGSVSGDTTGVRDSVVNQLLAKMDGVKEANNVLVVGLTNRPELLDPALLRPGRLEVQLRVELPDLEGRRDILRIHTRRMKEAGGLSPESITVLEDLGKDGFPSRTEYFTGAELAGLVRSAASFALARTVDDDGAENAGVVSVSDLTQALSEIRPALGKQDEVLERRYPYGISPCSGAMQRIMRDLTRFTSTAEINPTDGEMPPTLQSMLVVGSNNGAGATALSSWAAAQASSRGDANYVRLVTSLDLLTSGGSGDEESSRAAALVERFVEASQMSNSLIVLDDVDQICAGSGPRGYSSIMIATLRALLRSPPESTSVAKAGGHSQTKRSKDGKLRGKTLRVLAATSRTDAACSVLNELFDETLVVPLLSDVDSVQRLLATGAKASGLDVANVNSLAEMILGSLGTVSCKTALRLMERSVAIAGSSGPGDLAEMQENALASILEDLSIDEAAADQVCVVI